MSSHIDCNRVQHRLLMVLSALVLAGCAGASVSPGTNGTPVGNGRPSAIYVYPFAVTAQDVTLNQGLFQKTYRNLTDSNQDQSQLNLGEQTASALAAEMIQRL